MLLVSCAGGSSSGTTPTPPAVINDPTATAAPAGDPGALVEQAVQACREKDAGLLRSLVAAELPDHEIEELFARGTDVRLAQRGPAETAGDSATIVVHLEIHRASGEIDGVERTWLLVLDSSGSWRFGQLPDCY